jgi:hypothetical protein
MEVVIRSPRTRKPAGLAIPNRPCALSENGAGHGIRNQHFQEAVDHARPWFCCWIREAGPDGM